ncbi:MAG: hypothetical protein HZB25_01125 [Candidatus Eisenbacteria bacterium]|nr:hypothetical protein [Candidatus Eisenbacteria bacterium]
MLNPGSVLLRVPNWIGDAAMATAVVSAFAAQRPDIHLEIAGRGAVVDLFPGLLPAERCHRLGPGFPAAVRGRFDLGVLLPDSLSSAWINFRNGIPSLGRRADARTLLLRHPRPPRPRPPVAHVVEEWDDLLEPLGVRPSQCLPQIILTAEERAAGRETLMNAAEGAASAPRGTVTGIDPAQPDDPGAAPSGNARAWTVEGAASAPRGTVTGIDPAQPDDPGAVPSDTVRASGGGRSARIAVLSPGAAYGTAKRWPTERFAALAIELREEGIASVAAGAAGEEESVQAVAQAVGTRPLVGLPVREWAAALAAATVVVTNDSGAAHVAAACGTPVLALFGSTSPTWTRPRGEGHRVLTLGLPCAPCFRRECPLGHLDCLLKMDVRMVREAALEMCAVRPVA